MLDGSLLRTTGQLSASYSAFLSDFEKMVFDESDLRKIVAGVQATSWRLRKTIWVRELAATYRLGQMRRLLMLEEQKAWKREVGFDYIDTEAEMDARRSRANIASNLFFSARCSIRDAHIPMTNSHLR